MITSGAIGTLGNTLSQLIDMYKTRQAMEAGAMLVATKFSFIKMFGFFLCGTFYFGPLLSVWYRAIDKKANKLFPEEGSRLQRTAFMLGCDQTIGAPGCNYFFCVVWTLVFSLLSTGSMASLSHAFQQAWQDIPGVLSINYRFWPFVNCINFFFTPMHYRVLVSNLAGVVWNIILSTTVAGG